MSTYNKSTYCSRCTERLRCRDLLKPPLGECSAREGSRRKGLPGLIA